MRCARCLWRERTARRHFVLDASRRERRSRFAAAAMAGNPTGQRGLSRGRRSRSKKLLSPVESGEEEDEATLVLIPQQWKITWPKAEKSKDCWWWQGLLISALKRRRMALLFMLWLWALQDWARALNPSDPNVCSYWESVAQALEEPCDQAAWPSAPTCPRHKVLYKVAYRQGVKLDYRRRYRCCQGYYESGSLCVPRCTHECVHGRCVAPDRCQCEQGWRGSDCSHECSSLFWGPACQKPCLCARGAGCDPLTGSCSCPPGFRGTTCKEPCPPGTYGPGCLLACRCEHGALCDVATGACNCSQGYTGPHCELACLSGPPHEGLQCSSAPCPCQNGGLCHPPGSTTCICPPGWMGALCSLPCPAGRFGSGCQGECQCRNGGQCRRDSGQCQCAPGYTGEHCREECPAGRYGQDCAQRCDCANGGRCFPLNGACLCEAGFLGDSCEERECPAAFYGLGCRSACLCHPQHTRSCHPLSGECTCQPGWAGLSCNETCPPGYHGLGCRDPCLCLNGGRCDGVTGLCRCPAGYTDKHCASPCPPDSYGPNCSLRCACRQALGCSPVDGRCLCKEGWQGADCSLPCPAGTWGFGCNESCACPCPKDRWGLHCSQLCSCRNGASCSPTDGSCECTPGFRGPSCHRTCPSGRYGKRCSLLCQCANHSICHPVDGACDCPPGWMGTDCSRRCPPGRFGANCTQRCQCQQEALCDPEAGRCACPSGYTGAHCETSSPGHPITVAPAPPPGPPSMGAVVGLVVLAALLVGVLVLFLSYRHWQKDKQSRHLSVAYTAGGADGSEYAVPDVPPSYTHHYYSNPSYHTLSPCSLGVPGPGSLESPSSGKLIASQFFPGPRGGSGLRERPTMSGPDCNATLPADWKHCPGRGPLLGQAGPEGAQRDRSYSYTNGLSRTCGQGCYPPEEPLGWSRSSLSSENPYSTIKDLPVLPSKPPEGSYVEMKSPTQRERSYAEISLVEEPEQNLGGEPEGGNGAAGAEGHSPTALGPAPNHYDSPKNSHIPSHYDIPPVRHYPPSPPLSRQGR
nr:platelet endothelial aggregation receptor 1 [Pogona vitticeps]